MGLLLANELGRGGECSRFARSVHPPARAACGGRLAHLFSDRDEVGPKEHSRHAIDGKQALGQGGGHGSAGGVKLLHAALRVWVARA